MTDRVPPAPESRLESWKDIAAYLNRDARTVRRWEQAEGLPVHRHRHLARSSVYAFPSELDAWREGRKPENKGADQAPGRTRSTRLVAAAAITVLTLLSAGGGRFVGPAPVAAGPAQQADVRRRVMEGGYAFVGDVSADGRFAVGSLPVGYRTWDVVLREVATNRSRVIVPGSREATSNYARISDDGEWVVYTWWDRQSITSQASPNSLRLISTRPGAASSFLADAPPGSEYVAMDWAADGSGVLVRRWLQPGGDALLWVDIPTGTIRTIREFEPWRSLVHDPQVSPDGKFIAFSAVPSDGATDRYIYLIDVDTLVMTPIVTSGGSRPYWTPDGRHLVFRENGNLWALAMDGGRAVGEPRRVATGTGPSFGFAKDGRFLFRASVEGRDHMDHLYVVPRTPAQGGRAVSTEGASGSMSPDGRTVAFTRMVVGGADFDIVFRDLSTGQERSYKRRGLRAVSPRWMPDGSGVVVMVYEGMWPFQPAFHLLDITSGSFRRLAPRDSGGIVRTDAGALSPDGRTLYLGARASTDAPVTSIVGLDLFSGESRLVASIPAGLTSNELGIALSPDGTTLAAYGRSNDEGRIFTVGVDGANFREVVPVVGTGWVTDVIRWTPDGRSLVFVAADDTWNWRVMRVDATGGTPVFDGLSFETLVPLLPDLQLPPGDFNEIDLHPDGTHIVASTRTLVRYELWSLDHLIDAVNAP